MTAPDRIGDTIVAAVRRTGTAERRPPPISATTVTSTTTPAATKPITIQRRRSLVGDAESSARLIRSAERSAFLASMALNRNTFSYFGSAVLVGVVRRTDSRPGRLRRRIPEDPPRGTLRRRLLLLRPFALSPRGRRRRVRRQPLAGHHHLHLLTLQRFALEQCRGQAIERGAPLGQDPLGFTIGVRENIPHFLVHDLGRAVRDFPPLHHFAAQEDLLLAVADRDGADDRAHAELRHHAPRDVGRLLDILRRAGRHLLRPEH